MKFLRLVLALAFVFQSCIGGCRAADGLTIAPDVGDSKTCSSSRAKFFEIDRRILLEGIELARFNIYFHRKANEHWWLRGWLYPIAQTAGAAGSLGNNVVDIAQRADAFNDPGRLSIAALRRGLASSITGNTISGTSSALELAQNTLVILRANHAGFSPGESLATVKAHLKEIDDLLAERDHLIATSNLSEEERKVRSIEGHVMERIRDQLVQEFTKWSVYSREFMWHENTFFTIDSLQNFTQVAAGIMSVRGFHQPAFKGASGLSALAANSVATMNPLLSAGAAYMMRLHQRSRLKKELPFKYWDPTKEAPQEFTEAQRLVAAAPNKTSLSEVTFLVNNSTKFDNNLEKERREINKLRRVADQQVIAGPIIGLMSVAQSLSATIAYYGYRDSPISSNRISLGGRISKTAGQSYSMMATVWARVRKTIYDRRLAKEGRLPLQVLQRRLDKLDSLEDQVRAARL
jgi:hypothetical protein